VLGQEANNPDRTGIVPYGTYEGGDIDHIDMSNGNVYLTIPLYSLPQRGSLSLSFSAPITGASNYTTSRSCSQVGCRYNYNLARYPGPTILFDQLAYLDGVNPNTNTIFGTTDFFIDAGVKCGAGIACSNSYMDLTYVHRVKDSTGNIHYLGYDPSTSFMTLRSADGSGYMEKLSDPNAYKNGAIGTLYDAKGIRYDTTGITDPNGNHITIASTSLTDSVGRIVPRPPSDYGTATNLSSCPNLNNPDQPATSAITWSLPGPTDISSGTVTYTICYTTFYYLTNFLKKGGASVTKTHPGAPNGPSMIDTYTEAGSIATAIQSIVYPDGTAWSFEYDGSQSASTVAYGDLVKIHLPTGGTIAYSYSTLPSCTPTQEGFPQGDSSLQFRPYSRSVVNRTLTQLDGTTQIWTYGYNLSTTFMPTGTVGRPDGNSTVYQFSGLGGSSQCSYVETGRTDYQGSSVSGAVKRSTVKTYSTVQIPETIHLYQTDDYWTSTVGVNNGALYEVADFAVLPALQIPFLKTAATSYDQGSTTTATYYYDPGLTNVQPFCSLADTADTSTCNWNSTGRSTTAILGRLTSVVTTGTDGHGGTLSSTQATSYKAFNSTGITNPSYYNANLLDFPLTVSVQGSASNSSTTTYGYDESNGSPGGVLGNRTSTSVTGSNGGSTSSSTVYNSQGMPISITDGRGNTTTLTYGDASAVTPTSISLPSANGVSHIDSYTWDANTGKMTSHTDQNQVATNYAYNDSLGRLTLIDAAVGTTAESKTKYSYSVSNTVSVQQDKNVLGDGLLTSSSTVDGFGRVIHVTDPAGATVDTTYDKVGNIASVSNPYVSTSDPTYGLTTYSFDAISRPITVTHPGGSQSWSYNDHTVTFMDENNNQWTRTSDALGRLTSVLEPNGTTALPSMETDYSYDALGNPLLVTQKGNGSTNTYRTRSFYYDSLSRLLCASNPENSSATCPTTGTGSYVTGTTGYTYDANGNLYTKTSPLVNSTSGTQTIGYCYDALNRITYKFYTGTFDCSHPSGYAASYSYDSSSNSGAQNVIGRLTDEKSYAESVLVSERQPYAYDAMGRLLQENQYVLPGTASAKLFSPAYKYDLAGNVTASTDGATPVQSTSTTFPCVSSLPWTTLAFSNCFDSAGRLSSLTSNWATYPTNLFTVGSSNGYNPAGQLQNWTQGSVPSGTPALSVTQGYTNRLWLQSITANGQTP